MNKSLEKNDAPYEEGWMDILSAHIMSDGLWSAGVPDSDQWLVFKNNQGLEAKVQVKEIHKYLNREQMRTLCWELNDEDILGPE